MLDTRCDVSQKVKSKLRRTKSPCPG
jgi:hypothetical protein